MTRSFYNIRNVGCLLLLACLPFQLLKAQKPEELKLWLPEVDGWEITSEIEVFNPDNLFDRINGAAPLFIENNFREMTSMEYKKGADYITIQAYRHATPEDAFGMYSSERSSELRYIPVGGEGQGDGTNLYFFAGNIYVKMWSNASGDVSEELQSIGKKLAEKIDPQAAYPVVLRAFPEKDCVPYSAAYITSNYIGHEFLNTVYTMKYKKGDISFQLFVIDGKTADGTKETLSKYFTFTKQPQEFKEGALLINDKYNGEIPVLWKGRYLLGLYSENGDTVANAAELLNELAAGLFSPLRAD